MTQQVICDGCGQPIDQTIPYYTLSGSKVQMQTAEENAPNPGQPWLITLEPARQFDYHPEHLPGGVAESMTTKGSPSGGS